MKAQVVLDALHLLPDGQIEVELRFVAAADSPRLTDPGVRLVPRGSSDEMLVDARILRSSPGEWAVGCTIPPDALAVLERGPDLVDVYAVASLGGELLSRRLRWAGSGERWLPQPTPSRKLSWARVSS
ncbi:hypothetical protein GCM10022199_09250 [Marihabitans asiaticum]